MQTDHDEPATPESGATGLDDLIADDSWGEIDESQLDPRQRSLNFAARSLGILLLATWILPIGRIGDSPINVWDSFGVASTMDVIRLVLPGVVGLVFVVVGFFLKLDVKLKSTVMAGALLLTLIAGVNPFAVLSVVTPPIDGRVAEVLFGMVGGSYFPREGTLHLVFLGAGLAMFGIAGRYRYTVQTSRLGPIFLMVASAIVLGYYAWPYDSGKVPAIRNVELYQQYYEFPEKFVKNPRAVENAIYQAYPDIIRDTHFIKLSTDAKLAGQVKLTAVYFMCIYFIPLVFVLLSLLALRPSRYQGHRTISAKLIGWGSSTYLLAFIFPLLLKETGKTTGDGFMAALRNYVIFLSVFIGATVAFSAAIKEWVEPDADNDSLPDDPLAWKES